MVLRLPNTGAKWFTDTEADTDGNSNNQKRNKDLDDDSGSVAIASHALAGSVVDFGCPCFLPPMLLARPDRTVRLWSSVARRCLV